MDIFWGLGLLVFLIPLNVAFIRKAKKSSFNQAYMLMTLTFLSGLFITLFYTIGIMFIVKPEFIIMFTLGLLFSIVITTVFKIYYEIKLK
jgi:hypothetical protein